MLNGGYYWLPLEYISEINFEPVDDLRDLVWRAANLTLKNKGQLIVFIPVRYPINAETSDLQLLARTCDWQEPVADFYVGNGQRVFMSDKNEYPLLNIKTIKFTHQ
jgi:type VI secretion system protein ImpE